MELSGGHTGTRAAGRGQRSLWEGCQGRLRGEMGFEGCLVFGTPPPRVEQSASGRFRAEEEEFLGPESINLVVTEDLWTEIVGD